MIGRARFKARPRAADAVQVPGDRPSRWGRDEISLPLWLRILLSTAALVPAWLIWRTVGLFQSSAGSAGAIWVDILLGLLGFLLIPLTVWYLRDLWRVNPQRRKADWAAEREAARIARAFARERQGMGD
jgi:hypothetical protein